jgi:hypothetical protein
MASAHYQLPPHPLKFIKCYVFGFVASDMLQTMRILWAHLLQKSKGTRQTIGCLNEFCLCLQTQSPCLLFERLWVFLMRCLDWKPASDDEERLGCMNSSSWDHAGWGEYAVKWPWCIDLLPPLPPWCFIKVLVRVMELSGWRGDQNWWLNSPDTMSYRPSM